MERVHGGGLRQPQLVMMLLSNGLPSAGETLPSGELPSGSKLASTTPVSPGTI